MKQHLSNLLPLATVLLLAACTTPGDFPSLDIRDSERVAGSMEAPPALVYTPPPLSTATVADLATLAARVRAAHQRFMADAVTARATVARGAGSSAGSAGWSDAQVALAGLETHRSDAMIALADIDRVHVDTHVIGGDVDFTEQVRAEASALVAEEDRLIESLLGTLGG